MDFKRFLGDSLGGKVWTYFLDHHCGIFRNESMFVYENYFICTEVVAKDYDEDYPENQNILLQTLIKLKEYLSNCGYNIKTDDQWYEGDGYDEVCVLCNGGGIVKNYE